MRGEHVLMAAPDTLFLDTLQRYERPLALVACAHTIEP